AAGWWWSPRPTRSPCRVARQTSTSCSWNPETGPAAPAGPVPGVPPSLSEDPHSHLGRGGEKLLDLVVELDQGERRARHVQRGAVLVDVGASHRDAALLQLLVGAPVQDVELADRGAAQAVDHQRDPVARG